MITSFSEAISFLYSRLPTGPTGMFPAEQGIIRTKALLAALNNPQESLKIIHIAGTSGKGSTAYLVSTLLQSQQRSVGLHLSPHLLDIRERMQVNGSFISEAEFIATLNTAYRAARTIEPLYGPVTYFEFLVVMAFLTFRHHAVDYAVMETGLGGLYDATNTVSREDKVAVITRIGHDHTRILGKTLPEIATQKAGIIQRHNTVIMLQQRRSIMQAFEERVRQESAKLTLIPRDSFIIKRTDRKGSEFKYQDTLFQLSLLGRHQVENCVIALTVVSFLATRDSFTLSQPALFQALSTARFPGRLEVIPIANKTIILDGAHNPQKMKALLTTVQQLYPNQKVDFLIAFKQDKDFSKMLTLLLPHARHITVTSFSSHPTSRATAAQGTEIAAHFTRQHFTSYTLSPDAKDALSVALQNAPEHLVVTGSLYLLSELYPQLHAGKSL